MSTMSTGPAAADWTLPNGWLRELGSTGLSVSAVTAGGGPIGSMPEMFGYDVPAEQAIGLVTAILHSPIRLIDTSNGYSAGESERRIGEAIRRVGGLPAGWWVSTKVDGKDGDYSGRRIHDSIQESADRLGIATFPLVYLHDPEYALDQGLDAPGGAVDALVDLRNRGVIAHLGVAGGDVAVMHRFLDLDVFEVLLTHNRYTLVDRSADQLISRAAEARLGIANAAYLGGGMLADPHRATLYGYRPASPATKAAAVALAGLCADYHTDLATAALQFSLRDPRIHTSVVGISKPERLDSLAASVSTTLPDPFWADVETLLPDPIHWLEPPA